MWWLVIAFASLSLISIFIYFRKTQLFFCFSLRYNIIQRRPVELSIVKLQSNNISFFDSIRLQSRCSDKRLEYKLKRAPPIPNHQAVVMCLAMFYLGLIPPVFFVKPALLILTFAIFPSEAMCTNTFIHVWSLI